MRSTLGVLLLAACTSFGQTGPAFEVASIKATSADMSAVEGKVALEGLQLGLRFGMKGGPGTSDPGQITYTNVALRNLVVTAFGVKSYQVTGPAWMAAARFDIVAKTPQGATKDDVKLMLQNLLATRFGLVVHHEQKELPMYALIVGKNGPKLKETAPADANASPAATDAALDQAKQAGETARQGGRNVLMMPPSGGMRMMMRPGRMHMMIGGQSMAEFTDFLSNQLDRPVVDQTGLTQKYDIELDYAPESLGGKGLSVGGGEAGRDGANAEASDPAPTLFAAVQAQLGLKLEPKKGPVDLIVVDRLDRVPSEN